MYLIATTVFVVSAIVFFPLLGAKPDPADWKTILAVFHLDRGVTDRSGPHRQ
jgi:hypothetical protein